VLLDGGLVVVLRFTVEGLRRLLDPYSLTAKRCALCSVLIAQLYYDYEIDLKGCWHSNKNILTVN
jgi:hypothetical protein